MVRYVYKWACPNRPLTVYHPRVIRLPYTAYVYVYCRIHTHTVYNSYCVVYNIILSVTFPLCKESSGQTATSFKCIKVNVLRDCRFSEQATIYTAATTTATRTGRKAPSTRNVAGPSQSTWIAARALCCLLMLCYVLYYYAVTMVNKSTTTLRCIYTTIH